MRKIVKIGQKIINFGQKMKNHHHFWTKNYKYIFGRKQNDKFIFKTLHKVYSKLAKKVPKKKSKSNFKNQEWNKITKCFMESDQNKLTWSMMIFRLRWDPNRIISWAHFVRRPINDSQLVKCCFLGSPLTCKEIYKCKLVANRVLET